MTLSTYDLDVICLRNKLDSNLVEQDCVGNGELRMAVLDRLDVLKSNSRTVTELLSLPKVEQKSEEWYLLRQNLITASDFAQALGEGKFGSANDIITKKVRPSDESGASFNNPFFRWGNMFEPVANDIYSKLHYDVKLHEFGLIPHKTLSYFGASPDGITDTGIMLEIKCPWKRKFAAGDAVPTQYYYQIQGQLEVCELKECDYFECKFELFSTLDEFYKAYGDDRIKGVVIERDGGWVYSPIVMGVSEPDVSFEELQRWIDENADEEFTDIKFWYLNHYNLQRVTLDKAFVDEKLKELKVVWDKILYYRENPNRYDIEILKTITIGDKKPKTSSPTSRQKQDKDGEKDKGKMTGYCFIIDPDE